MNDEELHDRVMSIAKVVVPVALVVIFGLLYWMRYDCTDRLVERGWDESAAWDQCGCFDGGCDQF